MSIKPNPAMLGLLSWSGSMQMYAADHRWANAEIKERYRLFADGCFGDLTDAEWEQNCLTINACLLYTSPSPRDGLLSRMPSSA